MGSSMHAPDGMTEIADLIRWRITDPTVNQQLTLIKHAHNFNGWLLEGM
jgi:hypothetical protein